MRFAFLVVFSAFSLNVSAGEYTGTWWASPAGSESGWGINFEHQSDTIFATWYTYDTSGDAWWLSATLLNQGNGVFQGDAYETSGPSFDAEPFDSNQVSLNPVGWIAVFFEDRNEGSISYMINGVTQSKRIVRFKFAEEAVLREEIEDNDNEDNATKFLHGETLVGNLSSQSDVDWYSIRLTSALSGRRISIIFDVSRSDWGTWSAYWFRPDGLVLSGRNHSAPNTVTHEFPAYNSGTYLLRIQATDPVSLFHDSAPYRVTVKVEK
jgi:hypothetical protein